MNRESSKYLGFTAQEWGEMGILVGMGLIVVLAL